MTAIGIDSPPPSCAMRSSVGQFSFLGAFLNTLVKYRSLALDCLRIERYWETKQVVLTTYSQGGVVDVHWPKSQFFGSGATNKWKLEVTFCHLFVRENDRGCFGGTKKPKGQKLGLGSRRTETGQPVCRSIPRAEMILCRNVERITTVVSPNFVIKRSVG